jgi:hypothetical protein
MRLVPGADDGDIPLDEWPELRFQDKAALDGGNGEHRDPHVTRMSRRGPQARNPCTLEDIYDKADLFAVGRMHYSMWDIPFPSPSKDTYSDNEV